jgi:hypothetical protein
MGTWSTDSFGNDDAADWASDLLDTEDLSLIETAIADVLENGDAYLDAPLGAVAIAAVDVLARLQGNPGVSTEETVEAVEEWVARVKLKPSRELARRALDALDRITARNSELRELWTEQGEKAEWLEAIDALRARVSV